MKKDIIKQKIKKNKKINLKNQNNEKKSKKIKKIKTIKKIKKVGSDNVIMYKFFAKEICSSITVQKRAVMEENKKIKILANDLMRRLNNSMEQ